MSLRSAVVWSYAASVSQEQLTQLPDACKMPSESPRVHVTLTLMHDRLTLSDRVSASRQQIRREFVGVQKKRQQDRRRDPVNPKRSASRGKDAVLTLD